MRLASRVLPHPNPLKLLETKRLIKYIQLHRFGTKMLYILTLCGDFSLVGDPAKGVFVT